jgi:hypothetical protein
MPSPIYQYVINMVLSLPTRVRSGLLMNVSVRENRDHNNQIFDVAKFAILTPLLLIS